MPKLPKIYQNRIEKEINNNKKVYYGNSITSNKESIQKEENKDIETIIDDILSLPTYSFNINLLIHTKEKTYDTSLIAKTQNSIITFDNDKIPLEDIISIEKKV